MLQQLLKITSMPIKYELAVEHARLEYTQEMPKAEVNTTPTEINIETQDIAVKLDTYEARKSLGFANVADRIRSAAEKGKTAIAEKTREGVEAGKQMSNIEDGMTISQMIRQKMMKQPETYTAFLPSSRAEISWEPNKINIDYQKGSMDYNWQIMRNVMNYVPGSVRMEILQYPRVDVEYTGSPMYMPPSADPNYEEPVA